MPTLRLDFETRSKVDLKACGLHRYATDESTEVLCLAWKIDDEPTQLIEWDFFKNKFPLSIAPVRFRKAVEDEETIFMAFNAAFEFAIWNDILVERNRFPVIPLNRWRCSAAQAAVFALPRSLGGCGKALRLNKLKDEDGKRVMLKVSKPRKPTKNNPAVWHESPDDFSILYAYCIDDVDAEHAIAKAVPKQSPNELAIWRLDQRINNRGFKVDTKLAEQCIDFATHFESRLLKEFSKITGLSSVKQSVKFRNWLIERWVLVTDVRKNTLKEAVKAAEGDAKRAIEIRLLLAKSSIAKFKAMLNAAGDDDRVRGTLLYYGASTGRWAGRLVQPQNMPRGIFKNEDDQEEGIRLMNEGGFEENYAAPMDAVSSLIRGAIMAEDGKRLIAADYSQIEARVLPWLCDFQEKLDVFREGVDPYIDAASGMFSVAREDVTSDQRLLGKVAELALGYQGGEGAFATFGEIYGVEVDEEMGTEMKTRWRKANQPIVSYWYDQERAAMEAVSTGKKIWAGKVFWLVKGPYLFCRLPSGRFLAYREPKIKKQLVEPEGKKPYWKNALTFMGNTPAGWYRESTYGGKLVENQVQAVARCVLSDAMLRVDEAGYNIVFTVHDEIICEMPEGEGSVDEVIEIMSDAPEWTTDLPIAASGFEAKRYRKE